MPDYYFNNEHSNQWIREKLEDHYNESLEYFPENQIVGLFYQGSGNYGLDTLSSDVDTKLIVTPSLNDICLNKPPVSTTHIRENNEHIDFKDIRKYVENFKKQNLNFIEILFSPFVIINPLYKDVWNLLVENREEIGRYNPFRAIKSMKGIALEKFAALEHPYPSKIHLIEKYGYDNKQLHHLLRIEDFIIRYIQGDLYSDCIISNNPEYLKMVKTDYFIPVDKAKSIAIGAKNNIIRIADKFCEENPVSLFENNKTIDDLFNHVLTEIIKISIKNELEGDK